MNIQILDAEFKGGFSDADKFLLTIRVSQKMTSALVKAVVLPFCHAVISFDLDDIDLISVFFFTSWSFLQPQLPTKFNDCRFSESRDI